MHDMKALTAAITHELAVANFRAEKGKTRDDFVHNPMRSTKYLNTVIRILKNETFVDKKTQKVFNFKTEQDMLRWALRWGVEHAIDRAYLRVEFPRAGGTYRDVPEYDDSIRRIVGLVIELIAMGSDQDFQAPVFVQAHPGEVASPIRIEKHECMTAVVIHHTMENTRYPKILDKI